MNLVRQIWSERNEAIRPAVFVDRDGTMIVHREVLSRADEVELLPKAAEGLRLLKEAGYLLLGISNQPNVEKGIVSLESTRKINEDIQDMLKQEGVALDAMYFCPHRFGSDCTCRKPELGLIEAAQNDFDIDMTKSWLIGDTGRDMETGKRAGLRTIKVEGMDPDKHFTTEGNYSVSRVDGAAEIILQ